MAEYLAIASQLPQLLFEKKCDDDLTDRLNYRYTVAILLVFCVIVISRQSGSEVFLLSVSLKQIFLKINKFFIQIKRVILIVGYRHILLVSLTHISINKYVK